MMGTFKFKEVADQDNTENNIKTEIIQKIYIHLKIVLILYVLTHPSWVKDIIKILD